MSLTEFLNTLTLGEVLGRLMPFSYKSPNAIAPEQTLFALLISIIAGARRLAHTDWLRADRALHAMLGIERFPGTDTVRNLLKRFTQPVIEAFWRPLWRWLLMQGGAACGWLESRSGQPVFQRSGHQEGAERGYNPSRPACHTHHPLLAVLAEAPLVLHGWLRSGKAGSARGGVPFLQEALALMPVDWKLRTVRADSGFFDQALLSFLEERSLPYISVASFHLKLHGWSKERRFVVIREQEREDKSAVGRRLIDVPGYTYRVVASRRPTALTCCAGSLRLAVSLRSAVTSRHETPVELWRDYNQRACIEQRIEELKNDLAADGFCMKPFFATEAAFLSVLFALLRCAHPTGHVRQVKHKALCFWW